MFRKGSASVQAKKKSSMAKRNQSSWGGCLVEMDSLSRFFSFHSSFMSAHPAAVAVDVQDERLVPDELVVLDLNHVGVALHGSLADKKRSAQAHCRANELRRDDIGNPKIILLPLAFFNAPELGRLNMVKGRLPGVHERCPFETGLDRTGINNWRFGQNILNFLNSWMRLCRSRIVNSVLIPSGSVEESFCVS